MPTPTFKQLWQHYPIEPKKELFEMLGGGWPKLVNDEAYKNTCTVRLSVALNRVGSPITAAEAAADGGHKDGAGRHIALKVPTAEAIVKERFGEYDWGMGHTPGEPLDLSTLPERTGILIYRVKPAHGAYGHVDLWNRKPPCRVDCHSGFALKCHGIQLWFID